MLRFPSVCHQYPSSTDPKYTVFPVDTDKISFPQELLQQFRAVPASCIIFYFRSSMFIFFFSPDSTCYKNSTITQPLSPQNAKRHASGTVWNLFEKTDLALGSLCWGPYRMCLLTCPIYLVLQTINIPCKGGSFKFNYFIHKEVVIHSIPTLIILTFGIKIQKLGMREINSRDKNWINSGATSMVTEQTFYWQTYSLAILLVAIDSWVF